MWLSHGGCANLGKQARSSGNAAHCAAAEGGPAFSGGRLRRQATTQSSPAANVARPRKLMNPITSVTVVKMIDEA